jgi:hypothetical protein
MDTFNKALEQFKTNGRFIYQDACLSADNLEKLKASLVDLDLSNTYQFHLSDVELLTSREAQGTFFFDVSLKRKYWTYWRRS